MADRLKDRIRDYLAEHLDLLGDGLSLIQKEHMLPNPTGAGGRMDILARDKFGTFVVIEVKRSNEAARQTLNEIHKYTALLRIQQGLDQTQVRVIIVSTDWAELRLPLSECADVFPYTVDQFAITTLPDGMVTHVERVILIPKTVIIRLSRVQGAFSFQTSKVRDAALAKLVSAAAKVGVADFVILRLDYSGRSRAVCFPFALYFLFPFPLLNANLEESERLKAQVVWDDTLDQPDENFLSAVTSSVVGLFDDFEMGYPEKLTTILTEWKVAELLGYGRLARNHSLLNEADILRLAQAVEGGSPIYISKLCSPKHSAAWKQLQNDLKSTLRGMLEWERVVPTFLEEIESENPNASVSVDIFNPANLLMSLYPVASSGDLTKCARLEIMLEDDGSKCVRVLVSLLAWNGKAVEQTPEQIVRSVYGSADNWMAAQHFHETHTYEAKMLAAHNLCAPLVEFRYAENKASSASLLAKGISGLSRKPFDVDTVKDMQEFLAGNRKYLKALQAFLETQIIALPGSELMQNLNTENE